MEECGIKAKILLIHGNIIERVSKSSWFCAYVHLSISFHVCVQLRHTTLVEVKGQCSCLLPFLNKLSCLIHFVFQATRPMMFQGFFSFPFLSLHIHSIVWLLCGFRKLTPKSQRMYHSRLLSEHSCCLPVLFKVMKTASLFGKYLK